MGFGEGLILKSLVSDTIGLGELKTSSRMQHGDCLGSLLQSGSSKTDSKTVIHGQFADDCE